MTTDTTPASDWMDLELIHSFPWVCWITKQIPNRYFFKPEKKFTDQWGYKCQHTPLDLAIASLPAYNLIHPLNLTQVSFPKCKSPLWLKNLSTFAYWMEPIFFKHDFQGHSLSLSRLSHWHLCLRPAPIYSRPYWPCDALSTVCPTYAIPTLNTQLESYSSEKFPRSQHHFQELLTFLNSSNVLLDIYYM